MPIDFPKAKREVLSALRETADLAEDAGAETLAETLRDERIPKLEAERFHLVVLGEFNHGKTTFVNALLGKAVLPMGVTPTTAVIHHIEHGDAPKVTAVTTDGVEKPIELDALVDYEVGGDAVDDEVGFVELRYPSNLLGEGVVLVDTPGVNDLNLQRAEITYGYIPRSDAVIFVLDAGQILKESERQFITQKLLAASRDKLLFVINKIDQLDEEERAEAIAYATKHLSEILPSPKVFPLSAEEALAGVPGSGLEPFVAALREFLEQERGRVLLDNALQEGSRTLSVLKTSVEVQRRSLTMDQDDVEKRLLALEADLEGSSQALDARRDHVRESVAAVKAMVRSDVANFTRTFSAALPEEIETSKAEDLKKYLPGFIEERFREFAEKQAEDVARRLERVAEEAIAFVSDDAAKQSERLKTALGPAAGGLDLKVNTFAYDVGVFALGAVGLTVMALSNLLLGGALALAAPILAYTFRGRADKATKQRALEEAPKAVRELGDKLSEAFDTQIDEFAKKLMHFVEQASEEMSRSIAEVIRTVREAHRSGADAVAGLEQSSGLVLGQLGGLEERMKSQRRALWKTDEEPEPAAPPRNISQLH